MSNFGRPYDAARRKVQGADRVPETSTLSTDAFFEKQATRQAPHIFDPPLRLYDGYLFPIAATRSFDPDPHLETVLMAWVNGMSTG